MYLTSSKQLTEVATFTYLHSKNIVGRDMNYTKIDYSDFIPVEIIITKNCKFEKPVHSISIRLCQKLYRPTRSISCVAMVEIWSTHFSYIEMLTLLFSRKMVKHY